MSQGFSEVWLAGNPVPQVSLLAPGATPQNSPKIIGGAEREQLMLCDPLTGAPLDLQGTLRALARNIYMGVPTDGTIDAIRVMFAFTLVDVYAVLASGTTLLTIYKNDSPLDAGIAVSNPTETHAAYTTVFAAGDKLSVVLTNTSTGAGGLEVALGIARVVV